MNILKGKISEIKTHEGISLVQINHVDQLVFTSVVIDTPDTADYMQKDRDVKILFKETEVCISKDTSPYISIQNKIPCIIKSLKLGVILCQVDLKYGETEIKSIITSNACSQLKLKAGDHVFALIKSNEISLSAND